MSHEGTNTRGAWTTLALAAVLLGGCAGNNHAAIDTTPAEPHEWLFWPASMRIHPLTRAVVDHATGHNMIEARIEFLDRDEVTTRAVGKMYLSFYTSRAHVPGEPIEKWLIDLDVPSVNAERFDIVTRTYLFKLDLEFDEMPQRGVLKAFFVGGDESEMSDTLDVE
jgi:hypothetical protein